jgi:TonB family protein
MSRLRLAIGCCWATQVIAFDYQPASVPVASSVIAVRPMNAYAEHDSGYFSRRSSTFFLVVFLHAVLFYGVVTTLSRIQGSANPPPLQNGPLENPHPQTLPPPIPRPQMNDMRIDAPRPEFDLPQEPDPNRDVTTEIVREPTLSQPQVSPPHVAKQVQGGPGLGFPNPDDFYPVLARHLEEQGVATVRVCVDANGRLTADPTTLQGTGSPRLDEGALKLARAGSGHYRASTEDGQPVASCYPFRIRFQLKN